MLDICFTVQGRSGSGGNCSAVGVLGKEAQSIKRVLKENCSNQSCGKDKCQSAKNVQSKKSKQQVLQLFTFDPQFATNNIPEP